MKKSVNVYEKLLREELEGIKALILSKSDEYSQDGHALANFTRGALLMNTSSTSVWAGYWYKGIASLYLQLADTNVPYNIPLLIERCKDSIGYLLLLGVLVKNENCSREELSVELDKLIELCANTITAKGEQYTAGEDRFATFTRGARLLNTTPEDVLSRFMLKHTFSLIKMTKADAESYSLDLWNEKIIDHIVYLYLLILMQDTSVAKQASEEASALGLSDTENTESENHEQLPEW